MSKNKVISLENLDVLTGLLRQEGKDMITKVVQS
jgi:hypothetical protein